MTRLPFYSRSMMYPLSGRWFLKVSENMGISLLSDIALTGNSDQLVKIPMAKEDRILFYVSYTYSKHSVLSKETQKLITLIEKVS